MNPQGLLLPSLLALGVAWAAPSFAETKVSDPAHHFGLSGSHNQYKFSSDVDSSKERVNKGGVFYNWGNKLTGEQGFIYQIGADAQYGEGGDAEVKSARIELDIGARAALSANNYVDVLIGAGYDWDRYEYDGIRVLGAKERLYLDSKTPQVKAAVGYNYLTRHSTTRLEAGARYSIDGRTKLDFLNVDERVDMKDKVNPYAELTVLWNKGIYNRPVSTALYYEQTRHELKGASDSKLKQEEVGLRVGMQF